MIKKEITYVDFNEVTRTEDFYFNLTKVELSDMNLSKNGGYAEYLMKIVKAKDILVISDLIKKIIIMSYGEKTEDGRYFNKSPEISNRFEHSPAFDIIYEELMTDTDKAVEFFKGLIPKDLQKAVDEEIKKNPDVLKTPLIENA